MQSEYILLSESAIAALIATRHSRGSLIPEGAVSGVYEKQLADNLKAYATGREHAEEYIALVSVDAVTSISGEFETVYSRIARVLKAATTPPLHLPRSWAEFHFRNRVAFFAAGEAAGTHRWLAEVDGAKRVVKFLAVTDVRKRLLLHEWEPGASPDTAAYASWVEEAREAAARAADPQSFSEQVDLQAIGSDAVVQGYDFDYWLDKLKEEQRRVVDAEVLSSIRVVGPAGSGKTLTLCMRAIRLARDEETISGRKKILVVTHSWAMAERIDGILSALNGGGDIPSISVLPLLYVLQYHSGSVGGISSAVLGQDSAEGQRRVIDLIDRLLEEVSLKITATMRATLSAGVQKGLIQAQGTHLRNEFVLDVYQEIVGILSPQGIVPNDSDKVAEYLTSTRDESLPPFVSKGDRELCLKVYDRLLDQLVDLGVVTTDQLVLDSIRIFETFTWNVKREIDGYDFILIDELQLFDVQERLAVSLLSRAKPGMTFLSVEDPSQGLFSSVNSRGANMASGDKVYLEQAHRFKSGLFEFISYLYGKFPLNAAAIKVAKTESKKRLPKVVKCDGEESLIRYCLERVQEVAASTEQGRRVCIVCVSNAEEMIAQRLKESGQQVVRLKSFDDVEMLSYQRRSAVVSSWQFIGGTQFTDVVLVVSGLNRPQNAYSKIRELTAIYLGASRASSALDIVCDRRIPDILQGAVTGKLISQVNYTAD